MDVLISITIIQIISNDKKFNQQKISATAPQY
jgi:hypothetical protein